jgi:uridine phosphorylase
MPKFEWQKYTKKTMKPIAESELILNEDGSIYHLHLVPGDLAHTVISVGDPDRVALISGLFDRIDVRRQKREFITHTGTYKGKRMTVLSTGIGTDNIDIVYNELDALVNIDFRHRTVRDRITPLQLIRIGTSGSLQPDIPPGSAVVSRFGISLDGLVNYYPVTLHDYESRLTAAFRQHLPQESIYPDASIIQCDPALEAALAEGFYTGMTASCQGFYAPQGRSLRIPGRRHDLAGRLAAFRFDDLRITNFEMETGAMYGLARAMGHACCSVNLIVANRATGRFLTDAITPMKALASRVLDRLAAMS